MSAAPASADPVRVGLIGYGYAGRVFHAPLIAASDGIELIAVASSRPEAVRESFAGVAVEPTPAGLIARDDIDLIVIASPNDSHAPLARAALQAGKHVVVDKPFALSLDEARSVCAAAERAGRLLAVFHNRRWDSDFLSVRAAIERGDAGQVAHFESHFDRFRPEVRDRWRERAGGGGGIWYDLGPHLIDQALQLFGLPDVVEASLAALRPGANADDWAHAVLHYPDRRVILHASMLAAGGSARFIAHGTDGSLVKQRGDQQEAQLLAGMVPGAAGWGEDNDPLRLYRADDCRTLPLVAGDQRTFYCGVAHAISGTGPNPVPPIEALAVMAVIEAGLSASADRCATPLDLTPAERAMFAVGRRASGQT
ncbi:oxidoreductase [Sphingomonas jeddahensis]|uniref:Putative oxidoreductase YdgJ n=1 Tax=Sphingomonas jeddahensis TaxID=1915074 RepID=A0A1V2ETI9_9SPHN|nr:oxidoreductase [Sphingomonas jeddahensis]ONF95454.1 putative oxidoreductase YdgJ [Sphingomonas jeddahensis]